MRGVVTAFALLTSLASSLPAQVAPVQSAPAREDSVPTTAPRWLIGVAADIGQPVGAFKQNVNNAAGAQAQLRLRLDKRGLIALRLQGGWLNYGHESQRTCLGTTPSCRAAVNLTTANGILSMGVGPQLSMPLKPIRAYSYGLLGFSRFATVSGIGGGLMPDIIAADENYADAGLLWSGGMGLQLPVRRNTAIDVGVAYQGHGNRNYLLKGGLTDNPDGSLAFDVKRSNSNLIAISIGATTAAPWGRHKSTR